MRQQRRLLLVPEVPTAEAEKSYNSEEDRPDGKDDARLQRVGELEHLAGPVVCVILARSKGASRELGGTVGISAQRKSGTLLTQPPASVIRLAMIVSRNKKPTAMEIPLVADRPHVAPRAARAK